MPSCPLQANQLSCFVKQQKKRTFVQSAKQQWLLTAANMRSSRSVFPLGSRPACSAVWTGVCVQQSKLRPCDFSLQVESDVLSTLAILAAAETAGVQGSHTQLLVCRQEWDELQQDVLLKVSVSAACCL